MKKLLFSFPDISFVLETTIDDINLLKEDDKYVLTIEESVTENILFNIIVNPI